MKEPDGQRTGVSGLDIEAMYRAPTSPLAGDPPAVRHAPSAAPALDLDPSAYPSFERRLSARLIDIVVSYVAGACAGVAAVVALVILVRVGSVPQSALEGLQSTGEGWVGWVMGTLASIAYHGICEGLHGGTIGKAMLGIRVIGFDGRPRGLVGGLIRSFAILVDGLFFGMIAKNEMDRSERSQRLGDGWAKTLVVHVSALPKAQLVGRGRFVLTTMFGLAAMTSLLAATFVLRSV